MLKRKIIVLSFGFAALSGGLCFAQANNANPAPNPIEFYNLYNSAINVGNLDAAAGYAMQAWRAAEQKWGNTNPQTGALAYNAAWSQALIGKPQDGLVAAQAAVEIAPIASDLYALDEAKFLLEYANFKGMEEDQKRRKVDEFVNAIEPIENVWGDPVVIDALNDAAYASLSRSSATKATALATRAIVQIQRINPQDKLRNINSLLIRMQANLFSQNIREAISDIVDARLLYGRPRNEIDELYNLLKVWETATRAVAKSLAVKVAIGSGRIETTLYEDFSNYRVLTEEQQRQISPIRQSPNLCDKRELKRDNDIGEEIIYPSRQLQYNNVGAALIRVNLSSEGMVLGGNILSSIPNSAFGEAALKAILTWKYDIPQNFSPQCLAGFEVLVSYVME